MDSVFKTESTLIHIREFQKLMPNFVFEKFIFTEYIDANYNFTYSVCLHYGASSMITVNTERGFKTCIFRISQRLKKLQNEKN